MPSLREPPSRTARRRRTAALILAGVWLALLLGIGLAGIPGVSTPGAAFARALASGTTTPTLPLPTTPPVPSETILPTTPPAGTVVPTGTVTGTVTATGTVTGTVTATGTVTETATSSTDNGNYGDPSGGAEPTKVVFAQPTSGSHDDGPLQGLTPGAFTSNGLLLATTMSCIVTVLGIVVAVIAMSGLLRGGYWPFLRALALGKRAADGGGMVGGILGVFGKLRRGGSTPAGSRDDWESSEEMGALSESYKVPARGQGRYGAQRPGPPQRNGGQLPPSRGRDGW